MRTREIGIVVATALVIAAGTPAGAQQPIAYPAKGQNPQQQQRDSGECQAWAKQTTGIDPVAVAQAPTPQPQGGPAVGGGERVRGAARGAAGGAIIGGIAGDAGEGAAAGAVVGTMAGGARARRNKAAQQQQAVAQADTQKQQAIGTYNRAFAACMEGRGYTIK
jgi:outer membrane protein with glycine zipper